MSEVIENKTCLFAVLLIANDHVRGRNEQFSLKETDDNNHELNYFGLLCEFHK